MKRFLTASSLVLACGAAWATPVFHQPGANLTYGGVSNTQSLMSYVANPAAGASAYSRGEGGEFRMGLLSSIGTTIELGGVDGFKERFDELQAKLKENITIDQLAPLKTKFDAVLSDMGDQQYLMNTALTGHMPLFPLVISNKDWGGTYVLDVNAALEVKLKFLDSPLGFNPLTQKPETNSAVYAKAAAVGQVSLGYGRDLIETEYGSAYGGLRASYYYLGLHKSVIGFALAENLDDVLNEEGKKKLKPATGYGVDLGFLWTSRNYRVGATFANLNEPSFAYDPIGQDCDALTGTAQNSCLVASAYSTEIAVNEIYVMSRQTTLEGSIFTDSQNWVLGVNYDTNVVNDPTGNLVQNAGVSAAYATRSWWIPGFRIGYQANLAGSKLSYLALGASLFKSVHADVQYGLDSVQYEGKAYPRKIGANIGFDLNF